jgi:CRISPR/Cas system-associated exonuclease Cas4 (RecB family)
MEGKISRSKIELYTECPKCFYLDVKLSVKRPSIPGYTLNSAVDELLKKEFDILRKNKETHELMDKFNVNAVPFQHEKLDEWRHNFTGVRITHETGLTIFGAVDDLWINPDGELHVVDYKSTSTDEEISLDSEYKQTYKRQAEIYQYLLENSGFKVSNTAYFVFANALKTPERFDSKLNFEMQIISYNGDRGWVNQRILDIAKTLESQELPLPGENCKYCNYVHEYNNKSQTQPTLF